MFPLAPSPQAPPGLRNVPTGTPGRWSAPCGPAGCSLALLLTALAGHAPALSLFTWPILALALASRLLPPCRWTQTARLALLAVTAIGGGLADGWLAATALRLDLLLVLVLKWAEARSPREHALVAAGSLIAGALGLLQWSEGAALAAVALLSLLAIATLDADEEHAAPLILLRRATVHLATALPVAAVLFVFFPRIPGPLWDIGLTFGLPLSLGVEKSNQGLGVSLRLRPGQEQRQTGVSESQPVLVAEFENWVPPTSQLYWRGPVYYDFDGREWLLDPEYAGQGRKLMQRGWTSASAFTATLAQKGREIHYTVRLSPHERLWLYGLDLPSALTAESFIGPDWQVLSHRPVQSEMSYRLASYLDWQAGGALAPELRARALALPPGGNPRLRELGRRIAGAGDPDARLRAALAPLNDGNYKVRDRFAFVEGDDALDHFWFDTREGNADLYAGTFVFLMRAAGVPARLVTGYRGGKLMALTDYVVVKRSHAHAWVEIWDERRGWRRVDPVDLIAPERFAGSAAKTTRQAPTSPPIARPTQSAAAIPTSLPGNTLPASTSAAPAPLATSSGWHLPDLGALLGRWIFRLDASAQQSLIGGRAGGLAWLWLLAAAALASTLMFAGNIVLTRWRVWHRLPAPERTWRRICAHLACHNLGPYPTECPSDFARRIGALRPTWAATLTELAGAYTDWRYAPTRPDAAARLHSASSRLYNLLMADPTPPPRPPAAS
jgi:protein-glutamine gamma-glutamyltransferase